MPNKLPLTLVIGSLLVDIYSKLPLTYLPVHGRIKGTGSHCKRATAPHTKWKACIYFPLMFDTATNYHKNLKGSCHSIQ